MRVRVIGGGWYGCHLAASFAQRNHEVELWEITDRLFSGASGGIPARLHRGFHYPRSRLTRAACLDHAADFMRAYGHLTHGVPVNVYAVAAHDSLVDFGTYCQVLKGEVEFVTLDRPAELGLQNVEGAVLTGERHILTDKARAFFENVLRGCIRYNMPAGELSDPKWDVTIDCTFCALDEEAIERFEPCMTVLLSGPTDKAVTIMDGPFPSIYPWSEADGLCSLTSALYTPLSKTAKTWREARAQISDALLEQTQALGQRASDMLDQMAHFWPAARDLFTIEDIRLNVRAMPRSGAAARLVDVVQVGPLAFRVRAGKIDAVFHAEKLIRERLGL